MQIAVRLEHDRHALTLDAATARKFQNGERFRVDFEADNA